MHDGDQIVDGPASRTSTRETTEIKSRRRARSARSLTLVVAFFLSMCGAVSPNMMDITFDEKELPFLKLVHQSGDMIKQYGRSFNTTFMTALAHSTTARTSRHTSPRCPRPCYTQYHACVDGH